MCKFLIFTLVLFQSCTQLFDWQTQYPDNAIEEYIEKFVDENIGYEIDLTPLTGEERQNLKQAHNEKNDQKNNPKI